MEQHNITYRMQVLMGRSWSCDPLYTGRKAICVFPPFGGDIIASFACNTDQKCDSSMLEVLRVNLTSMEATTADWGR